MQLFNPPAEDTCGLFLTAHRPGVFPGFHLIKHILAQLSATLQTGFVTPAIMDAAVQTAHAHLIGCL